MTRPRLSSALLFISHAAADAEPVQQVTAFVAGRPEYRVYASSQPGFDNQAGEQWEAGLYARLSRAAAVIFVLTPTSLASRWCFAELALAKATGVPILTVRADPATPGHPLTEASQYLDLTRADAWEQLGGWLTRHVAATGTAWPEGVCPYPGMAAFTADMEPVFVGREAAVDDLLPTFAPLASGSGVRRVVAVSGPSGSGKSSFVLAGLVPRLRRRPGWRVLPPIRIGEDPFQHLAAVLAEADGRPAEVAGYRRQLAEGDPRALARLCVDESGGPVQLVVVIDQFEELALADSRLQPRFLELLTRVADGAMPVWLLLSVRSEFVVDTARNSLIADFVATRALSWLLLPLPADEPLIRRVVREPALLAGADVADDLLDRLVADVVSGDRSGASLPLLAFALAQTWERMARRGPDAAGRVLRAADYAATGGLGEVISRRAVTAHRRLTLRGLGDKVLPTLARFAVPAAAGEPALRRRVPAAALDADAVAVVREYEQSRLIRAAEMDSRPTYEVTHEALFTAWPELQRYIADNDTRLQDLAEAERRAHAWHRRDRDPGELLRGHLLHRLLSMSDVELSIDDVAVEYLRASVLSDDDTRRALIRDETARDAAAALQIVATRPLDARSQVLRAMLRCQEEGTDPPDALRDATLRVLCEARELGCARAGTAAVRVVAGSPAGRLVATGGEDGVVALWLPGEDGPYRVLPAHAAGVSALAFSADGRRLASAADDGTIRVAGVYHALDEGELEIRAPFPPYGLGFLPDGGHLAAIGAGGVLTVWRTGPDVAVVGAVSAHPSYGIACRSHPTAPLIFTAGADGAIASWSAPDCRPVDRVAAHDGPVTGLAVSPDGLAVASTGLDGTVRTWNARLSPRGSRRWARSRMVYPTDVVFSPTGRAVVSAGSDGVVRQSDLDGDRLETDLIGHRGPVTAVAVLGDGPVVVSGGADGTLRRWRYRGVRAADPVAGLPDTVEAAVFLDEHQFLVAYENVVARFSTDGARLGSPWEGHDDRVWDVAVSPAGDLVVSTGADGVLRTWTPHGVAQRELRSPDSDAGLTAVRFDATGARVLTGGSDGAVRLWTVGDDFASRLVGYHDGQVNKVDFGPDGDRVVSVGDDGEVRLWHPVDGQQESRRVGRGAVKALAVLHDRIYLQRSDGELGALRGDLTDAAPPVVAHDGRVTEIAAHPLLPLVTTGSDGYLRRWTADLEPVGEPRLAHTSGAWALAVSPHATTTVTGGNDAICLWRAGDWHGWLAELAATTSAGT